MKTAAQLITYCKELNNWQLLDRVTYAEFKASRDKINTIYASGDWMYNQEYWQNVTLNESLKRDRKSTFMRFLKQYNKSQELHFEALSPFPANSNPLEQDHCNMGTRLASNVFMLHSNFPSGVAKSLIFVHIPTGQRVEMILPEA